MVKRKLVRELIIFFKYLNGDYTEDGKKTRFYMALGDQTRNNGFKLQQTKVNMNIRKNLFHYEGGYVFEQVISRDWKIHPWKFSRAGWTYT